MGDQTSLGQDAEGTFAAATRVARTSECRDKVDNIACDCVCQVKVPSSLHFQPYSQRGIVIIMNLDFYFS